MKQRLFLNWQISLFVLIASLIATAAAASGPGYLAMVGPAPLRFAPMPQLRTNKFVLPARMPVPATGPVPPQTEMTPTPLPAPRTAPVIQPVAGDPAQPTVGSSPQEGVVSPQMLLKFFSKSTNAPAAPNTPLDFTPPRPSGAASSSATFSTGP